MILLFTDFGYAGFYVGQVKAALAEHAPGVVVIDLMHDAPSRDPRAAAYLLAALAPSFPVGAVALAVVDPGVGGPRQPLVLRVDERTFVGPDNGLFEIVLRRARNWECHAVDWRPDALSASFHGRDLFAPVAAALARGAAYGGAPQPAAPTRHGEWPDDLAEIVHVDGFGNLITGLRAERLTPERRLRVAGRAVAHARTFCDAPAGAAFWYANSVGLVEIAVNLGDAAAEFAAGRGGAVEIEIKIEPLQAT